MLLGWQEAEPDVRRLPAPIYLSAFVDQSFSKNADNSLGV
jgi:hypothetical protein